MSIIVAVHVNEGIVLASDRRTTYTNTQDVDGKVIQRIGVHATNSTDKTFRCPNGAGISACGDGDLLGKPITGYIRDMIRTEIDELCDIEKVPEIIINYFNMLEEIPDTQFVVAGYTNLKIKKEQRLYRINVKTKEIETIETTEQGATWNGETFTLTRLLADVALKAEGDKYLDMPFEDVLWGYFTLQDAVDFAEYAVETTIKTMRFKNVIETVGGEIDILVITPDETTWLKKVELINSR